MLKWSCAKTKTKAKKEKEIDAMSEKVGMLSPQEKKPSAKGIAICTPREELQMKIQIALNRLNGSQQIIALLACLQGPKTTLAIGQVRRALQKASEKDQEGVVSRFFEMATSGEDEVVYRSLIPGFYKDGKDDQDTGEESDGVTVSPDSSVPPGAPGEGVCGESPGDEPCSQPSPPAQEGVVPQAVAPDSHSIPSADRRLDFVAGVVSPAPPVVPSAPSTLSMVPLEDQAQQPVGSG